MSASLHEELMLHKLVKLKVTINICNPHQQMLTLKLFIIKKFVSKCTNEYTIKYL